MRCPFCRQQIKDEIPLEHMSACAMKESQKMETWLRNPAPAHKIVGTKHSG